MRSIPLAGIIIFICLEVFSALFFCGQTACSHSPIAVKTDSIPLVIKENNERIKLINPTFLGGITRNYYGDSLPDKLDIIYTVLLGRGETIVNKEKGVDLWSGAGWTGQPLIVEENGEAFLIIGAYDHNLKKIRISNGEIVWQYLFDDIIKGTGTIWHNPDASCPEMEYIIMQGSRLGVENSLASRIVPSYRGISLKTGKALWKFNSKRTDSYSRDVDGSAIVINDTAYIGLENGIFTVICPGPNDVFLQNGMIQPYVKQELMLYEKADRARHGGNLVTESSPCFLRGHIYLTSGSGHVYGYDIKKKVLDWDFYIGSDMDGSPVVTSDSCILVSVEKQYIPGRGGVFKLDPSLPPEKAVKWFFPVNDNKFADWEGGIIGSPSVNDRTIITDYPAIVAFAAIDGHLYVVNQNKTVEGKTETGPDGKTKYPTPQLIFKYKIGESISTPIIIGNRLLTAGYDGIYLFGFDKYLQFTLLDKKDMGCEATPFAYKKRVYIASRNGKLYCLGQK